MSDNVKALFLRDFTDRIGTLKSSSIKKKALIKPKKPRSRKRRAGHSPYDSNASEILTGSPFRYPIAGQSTCRSPICIVPPYTMIVGRLCRTAAIAQPGIFLSHPGKDMFPS